MLRLLPLLLVAVPLAAADAPPARRVTLAAGPPAALAAALQEQTGIAVDVAALDARPVPVSARGVAFWTALELVAAATDSRIVVSEGKVALKPGKSKAPSHVHGPFRFTAREVTARGDLDAGTASCAVGLDVVWEPGLHVFRTDGSPRITKATDDTGKAVAFGPGGSRAPTAWTKAPLTVHPTGLGRASKALTLEGSVTITLADELLTFAFPTATKAATAPAQAGVTAAVVAAGADGTDWVVEVLLTYPKGGAVFESHEDYWLRNNVMRLLPPGGQPIRMELDNLDRAIRYVAKGQGKKVGAGWTLDYRTPGPPREVTVPFVLKDIPLP